MSKLYFRPQDMPKYMQATFPHTFNAYKVMTDIIFISDALSLLLECYGSRYNNLKSY